MQRRRAAKELLLSEAAPESAPVTLLGDGSRLVGGARSVELARTEVERLVSTASCRWSQRCLAPSGGAVPLSSSACRTRPMRRSRAIWPSSCSAMLAARAALGPGRQTVKGFPVPDTLLLNGGVFRAAAITRRITELLQSWRGRPLRVLHNADPDLAVARGAVVQALLRGPAAGPGRWHRRRCARSYFLLLKDGGREQCLCVLPRGTPRASRSSWPVGASRCGWARRCASTRPRPCPTSPGRPASWRMSVARVSCACRRWPPVLPPPQGKRRAEVEVGLVATMTELGTLEVQAVACDDPQRRWRLAFDLRAADSADQPGSESGAAVIHPRLADAIALIDRVFGEGAQRVEPREVSQLRAGAGTSAGPARGWEPALARALFDALLARARRRRRSAAHERAWLNLAGYCLRPGTGAPLDDWRVEQLWQLYEQGLQFGTESNNWSEWWTLWRRAAGGLGEAAQIELLQQVGGHLEQIVTSRSASHPLFGAATATCSGWSPRARARAAWLSRRGRRLAGGSPGQDRPGQGHREARRLVGGRTARGTRLALRPGAERGAARGRASLARRAARARLAPRRAGGLCRGADRA